MSKQQRNKAVIGEFQFADPSFRTNSRIVAIKSVNGVCFALEYQSDDEPGVWIPEVSFPWHEKNFDSVICAAYTFNKEIAKIIKYREKKAKEAMEDV